MNSYAASISTYVGANIPTYVGAYLPTYLPLIAFIIFCILLVVYIYSDDDYLYGFWLAEGDEFCELADIDSIMLFVGDSTGYIWKERKAYLIIATDMANDPLVLSYRKPAIYSSAYTITAKAEFEDDTVEIWPEYVSMDVDINAGTLKIYSGDTVYARLYKQHETTEVAKLLED
tara:strand:- start:11461 stop:11982 length:522 start_codon:yes stop_codon:yes gene_type:complete